MVTDLSEYVTLCMAILMTIHLYTYIATHFKQYTYIILQLPTLLCYASGNLNPLTARFSATNYSTQEKSFYKISQSEK